MIELLDGTGALVAPIETAICCGYDRKLNEIGSATLQLARGDEANAHIVVPISWLRLWDGERFAGLYRFKSATWEEQEAGGVASYELESAECTLLDDMLVGCHELGGTGLGTRWVIEYILARQTVRRWVLGRCDFTDYYQYNFEDVTLLEALMSLGEVLTDDYAFQFDAASVPWTVNLVRLSSTPARSLVYGRNVSAIRRTVDGRVATRLVGRGYGEGDNQLTIAAVNGGLDYIDADAQTMARYGVRVGLHADRRQTDPNTLLARMRAILEGSKRPRVSYEATCADLFSLTGESWDDAQPGDMAVVLDEELGEAVHVRVTQRKKADIESDPGGLDLTLDSSVRDTAEEINEILDKIGVQELYSQGATNLYSMQMADSCDETHPLELNFYVPGNVLRINRCLLKWKIEAFRSYTKLAASGGASTRTSSEGGGATVTLPAQTIRVEMDSGAAKDSDGGSMDVTGYAVNASGDSVTTTSKAGKHTHNMTHTHVIPGHSHQVIAHAHSMTHTHGIPGHGHAFSGESKTYSIAHNHSLAGTGAQATGGIYSGNKSIQVTPEGTVEDCGIQWASSPYDAVNGSVKGTTGDATAQTGENGVQWASSPYDAVEGGVKSATEENGEHVHSFDHKHPMDHKHSITHQHVIPSMQFELSAHSHSVSLPAHTHELEYGIYSGSRADSVTITVDGNEIPAENIGEDKEIDIAAYMRAGTDGRVTRGAWHRVAIAPDKLTRITVNLFFQVFIQSRGAGDY